MIRAALLIVLAAPAGALAQGYYGGGSPYTPAPQGAIPTAGAMPNFYNPQVQPLSPYLNLTRGGNPAVNYYYGVRPGQIANGQFPGGAPLGFAAGQAFRTGFVPALQQVPPGEPPVVEANPGAVAGFDPIGPAQFGTGLSRFYGVNGVGRGGQGGGRIPNQTIPSLGSQPNRPAAATPPPRRR